MLLARALEPGDGRDGLGPHGLHLLALGQVGDARSPRSTTRPSSACAASPSACAPTSTRTGSASRSSPPASSAKRACSPTPAPSRSPASAPARPSRSRQRWSRRSSATRSRSPSRRCSSGSLAHFALTSPGIAVKVARRRGRPEGRRGRRQGARRQALTQQALRRAPPSAAQRRRTAGGHRRSLLGWSHEQLDSFGARSTLEVGGRSYEIFRLDALPSASTSPACPTRSRCCWRTCCGSRTGVSVTAADVEAIAGWDAGGRAQRRDPLPAGPGADAGLHRRPRRRRPGGDARRDGRDRRRPGEDQPAGRRRPGDRPLGPGRRLRQRARLRRQRRARVRAQPRALLLPQVGAGGLRQLQRRAAGDRDLPPGQPRAHRPGRLQPRARRRRCRPTPTPWSAPTRTRRWSTGSACSAGASAGSRPRRRCWASRSRCCCRRWSASSSAASCPRGRPRPTWS